MTRVPFPLTLTLLVIGALLAWTAFTPLPDVVSADAPANEFSAARAMDELRTLLGDQKPHPVGSASNAEVRTRLMNRLTELGMTPTTQHTVGCNARWSACGTVTNVVAVLPGKRETGILLMAHYDSVPYAPGAGDDGAGVAALIEVARSLKDHGTHENSVWFLFSDAEEAGLLGAEAYFAEHPAAKLAKVVINLEGSGSGGPVFLLRVGPNSGALVREYRHFSEAPAAQSFAQEIFKRMPNDTDFSVSTRANVPGIDFSFAGERNHYHTPLDTIEMLDPGTMQHHGDNVLPLVHALLDADLDATEPNFVFASQMGGWWLTWSPATGMVLSVVAIVLLGAATWRVRSMVGIGKLSGGVGSALLVLIGVAALELAALWVADLLAGARVNWPANPMPWLLVIYASPLVFVAFAMPPLARRLGFWAMYLGAWWMWSLLGIVCAFTMPLAAHLLLPASIVAALLAVTLAFVQPKESPRSGVAAVIVAALVAAYSVIGLAYRGTITQGLSLAAVTFVPLALLVTTLTPLLVPRPGADMRIVQIGSSVALIAGLAWTFFVPLYSELRPQHLVFQYVLNADSGETLYVAWSPGPLPQSVLGVVPFEPDKVKLPWRAEAFPAAAAPARPAFPPDVTALDDGDGDPKTRALLVRSNRGASEVALQIPKTAPLESIEVEGRPVGREGFPGSDYIGLYLVNPPRAGYRVALRFANEEPVDAFVLDATDVLPEFANELSKSRGALAVPVHDGDKSVIYRRVKI